jgi:hypothetical protein
MKRGHDSREVETLMLLARLGTFPRISLTRNAGYEDGHAPW